MEGRLSGSDCLDSADGGLLCVMLVKTIEIYGLQQVCIVAVYLWSISELESYLNAEHQP